MPFLSGVGERGVLQELRPREIVCFVLCWFPSGAWAAVARKAGGERGVGEAVAGSLGAARSVHGGGGRGRRAGGVGRAVAVVAGGRALPPARARVYESVDACLLTGARGLSDPAAAQDWAGMEAASRATSARVSYLAVTGSGDGGGGGAVRGIAAGAEGAR